MIDDEDWRKTRLVAVDVEGNGAQPAEIIELAIVAVENGEITSPIKQWLVRPAGNIAPRVTRLHGITDEIVATAPRFEDIAAEVRTALGNDFLVAHHAKVELGILTPLLPGWKPRGVFDTLALSRRFLPGRKSYSLTSLTSDLRIEIPNGSSITGPHRAAYDALMIARLFLRLAFNDVGLPRPVSTIVEATSGIEDNHKSQASLF